MDARGNAVAHTGEGCIPYAGDEPGVGFSCQANMMAAATVPAAMAAAYRAHTGDLTERLLAALYAAESVGGDVRGRQSAALRVVPASGEPWRTRFELRVEDHSEPAGGAAPADAPRARVRDRRARGRARWRRRHRARAELYLEAAELAPEADELLFWAGVGVATQDLAAGADLMRRAAARKASWLTLLERLPAELAPAAEALRAEL